MNDYLAQMARLGCRIAYVRSTDFDDDPHRLSWTAITTKEYGDLPVAGVPYAVRNDNGYADLVCIANGTAIWDELGPDADPESPLFWVSYHDCDVLYMRLDKTHVEHVELAERLLGYPVYDEDKLSDLEYETEMENWDSYGRTDFRQALVMHLGVDDLDTLNDDAIDKAAWFAREHANVWTEWSGSTCTWIDLDSNEALDAAVEHLRKEGVL